MNSSDRKTVVCLRQKGGLHNDGSDSVGINVRGGSPVLQITKALGRNLPGDANTGTTVGNPRAERANVCRLVPPAQSLFVVFPIHCDVFVVPFGELHDSFLDRFDPTRLPHSFRREVGVAARTVPISLQRLRVERHLDVELFRNANEQEASHP